MTKGVYMKTHLQNAEQDLIQETLKWLSERKFDEPIFEARAITGYRIVGNNLQAPDGSIAMFTKDKVFKHIKHLTDNQKRNVRRILRGLPEPNLTAYNDSRDELYLVSNKGLYMIKFSSSRSGKSVLTTLYKADINGTITFHAV